MSASKVLRSQACATWLSKGRRHLEDSGFLSEKQNKTNKETHALGKENLSFDIDFSYIFWFSGFFSFPLKIISMPNHHIMHGMLMNYLVSLFVPEFSFSALSFIQRELERCENSRKT